MRFSCRCNWSILVSHVIKRTVDNQRAEPGKHLVQIWQGLLMSLVQRDTDLELLLSH